MDTKEYISRLSEVVKKYGDTPPAEGLDELRYKVESILSSIIRKKHSQVVWDAIGIGEICKELEIGDKAVTDQEWIDVCGPPLYDLLAALIYKVD